jgi:hypothetical protein
MRRSLAPLSVLLILTCLVTTGPLNTFAQSPAAAKGRNGQWTIDNGQLRTRKPGRLFQERQQEPVAKVAPTNPDEVQPAYIIREDTPVKLRLEQTLSSGTAKLNDKVDFTVMEDVKVGEHVVIAQGDYAIATVTQASPKKSFGRAGKLIVNIDYVRLADGSKCALRSVKGGSGGNHTAAMTTAVVATAIVFFPAAPLFFFIKGKNLIIPKGTEITAYVAAPTPYLPKDLGVGGGGSVESANSKWATVTVRSTPEGAEIEVDGRFAGTTQSVMKLLPGDHTFRIKKAGFQDWTRTVTLSAGSSISMEAEMEKN